MKIIYLHGFRSSPNSAKAQMLRARFTTLAQTGASEIESSLEKKVSQASAPIFSFHSPQLPASPKQAIDFIVGEYGPGPQDCLIGSSLGGYYAAYLAQVLGCRCVLLNPAVDPGRDLAPYVGAHKMFHSDEAFVFKVEYLSELRALTIAKLTQPERFFLIAAKGDELLDWREMMAKYPSGALKLLEHSDHGLSDFGEHIDEVVQFCMSAHGPGV
jgi:uncharacterized protein